MYTWCSQSIINDLEDTIVLGMMNLKIYKLPLKHSFIFQIKIIVCNNLWLAYEGDYSHDTASSKHLTKKMLHQSIQGNREGMKYTYCPLLHY